MKRFILKNKGYLLIFTLLIIGYLITRFYNIMSLPMFTDEAIYTRWAQIAHNDSEWYFISLTDGKQPLFIWADLILMYVIKDPLLSGRTVSVICGLLSLFGMFVLAREVFHSKKVGMIAAASYVFYPFALVYDRMALYESMVTLFFIWGIYFSILLVRKIQIKTALVLGVVAGAGVLTKTSGFLTLYLLPFSLLLIDFSKKGRISRVVRWIILAGVSTIIAYTMYYSLRISPFFYIISQKNNTFNYPLSEWIKHPFTYLVSNGSSITDWTITYVGIPVLILSLAAFLLKRESTREKLYLFLLFFLPILVPIIFGRILFPRYIFFMTIPLLILASYSVNNLYERTKSIFLQILLTIIILIFWIRADYLILTDFARAPLPKSDTDQYINVWPAGGGYREMVSFFDEESKKGKIFVATEGTFGSLPTYTVEIYLGENKNIEKMGYYPLPENIPTELAEKAKEMPVYFVFNETQVVPATWPIEKVAEYQKGIGDYYMRIYKVVPDK